MPTWATSLTDLLWHSAIGVVPLAIIVAAICRWGACRPATRHLMWLGVLAWLPVGLFLPPLSFSHTESPAQPTSHSLHREEGKPKKHTETYAIKPEPGPTPRYTQQQTNSAWSRPTPPITAPESNEYTYSSADRLELASELVLDDHFEQDQTADPYDPTADSYTLIPKDAPRSLASSRREDTLTIEPIPPLVAERSLIRPTTPAPSSLQTQLSRWLAGLTAVRDAIGRLPTFPSALWLAGIVLIVAVRLRSVIRFRNRLRYGTSAPPSVVALVTDTAAKLGLRRVPETIMVHDHISPMIWCGRKARLVLPQTLWNELDDHGRRAVVSHELAHVRRKDHWVCWAESLVAATYWWHPLVWWVRGKMRDEAENCCDAWVTWLLPRGRRAYAEALLKTRQFAGETTAASAAPAIGMVTGKTKRFARRLTMVMTQQQTPRLSTSGIVLALSLAVAGWVATPARSDEPRKPRVVAVAPHAALAPVVAPVPEVSTGAPVAPTVAVVPTPPVAPLVSTVWAAPRPSHGHSAQRHGRDLAERMERLERRLTELAERLERVGPRTYSAEAAPPARRSRDRSSSRDLPDAVTAFSRALQHPPQREIVETYRLPKGQLEALTKLMVRPDVPIRVRPLEGAIELHGTEADHARFKAFIALLSNEKSVEAYHLPPGKLKALTALMALDDVPVMVEPGSGEIKVHGSRAVQTVFQAFVEMIQSEKGSHNHSGPGASRTLRGAIGGGHWGPEAQATARRALKNALKGRARVSAGRQAERAARQELKELKRRAQAEMRRATKSFSQKAKELERKADRLETEADRLEDRAQRARDKADALRDRLRENGRAGNESSKLEREADTFETQAKKLESQAEVLLAQAEAIQEQADAIGEQADEVTEQIEEQVETELAAVEEALEAAEEDADNDDQEDDDDDNDD